MDISWMNTLISSIAIFIGSIVDGIAGFGLAQVAMGIMPLFRSTASAAAILSVVAVVTNFRVWWSVRDEFDVKDWVKPVIGLVAGLPLGLYLLNELDEGEVSITIGIVLLIGVITIIIGKQTDILKNFFKDKDYSDGWILPLIAGFTAGVLAGAVAIPGPPMILYGTFMVATNTWTGKKMKATFTAFFGTVMLYRFIAVTLQGNMDLGLFTEALIAIPAMLLGAYLGIKIFEKVPQKVFSWIVVVMLSINAFILIFK